MGLHEPKADRFPDRHFFARSKRLPDASTSRVPCATAMLHQYMCMRLGVAATYSVNRTATERSVLALPARGVPLQGCARRCALLLRSRFLPGSKRELQVPRAAQSRLPARCGMPLRRPVSFLNEAAPARALPALPSSTAPVRQEPELAARLLQPRRPMHRAAVADRRPHFVPRRHLAKVGQSPPPQFAPQQYAPMPTLREGDRHGLRGFWARA